MTAWRAVFAFSGWMSFNILLSFANKYVFRYEVSAAACAAACAAVGTPSERR